MLYTVSNTGPIGDRWRRCLHHLHAADNFQIHINEDPGTHNFDQDNREALYRFLHQHLLGPDTVIEPVELAIEDAEIKSEEELAVPMPPKNMTLHDLAVQNSVIHFLAKQ